jgi:hypothetical protein
MSAVREKDSADYDLDRFVEMFDEALTSNDPRVKNALRQLMMMVILTSNEHEDRVQTRSHREGPLRRMQEDVRDMATRMHMFDEKIRRLEHDLSRVLSQPPASYQGGMGGQPKWPTRHDSTAYGQAIGGSGNLISSYEVWKNEKVAKYQEQISENVLSDLNIRVDSDAEGLIKK